MEMLRKQTEEMARIKQRDGEPKHPVRLSEEEALENQDNVDSRVNAKVTGENEDEDVTMTEEEHQKLANPPNQKKEEVIEDGIPADPDISAPKELISPLHPVKIKKILKRKPSDKSW